MSTPYKTIGTDPQRHEIPKIKGSRFIATVGRFTDESVVAESLRGLRAEFREANHHCFAWRHGDCFRFSDDGEPSGTAGRPILRQIDGHGLDRVFVIVTRIFGGTKLGAGGLMRAYGSAAREALDLAPVEEVVPSLVVRVVIPYELYGVLKSVVGARNLTPIDASFGEEVIQTFEVPLDHVEAFRSEVVDRTAGQARVELEPDQDP